ncbi:MAG: enolase C-terminal domain-like protein [SAR324 cluster bacterium]|jgi:muconate cycloisomerase|nr:hypothetical protein [Deltaproteobacteria bacterium]MDP7498695.1 enolase C-terminal domain-like protein [SAR324 cluster bacterium]|tara:strand:- start:11552 stop:12691 length:1140 start_codon:yes stop_codon:yes gene_type:complete
MNKESPLSIEKLDAYQVSIPLTNPYQLSKVYGTQTHCDAIIIRIETTDGTSGWGEADPGGLIFTGDTGEMVMTALRESKAHQILGKHADEWVERGDGLKQKGSLGAALDVAVHDALAHSRNQPLWALLGDQRHDRIDSLWPTSSGTEEQDLEVIQPKINQGFQTFMLKMGSRSVKEDLVRLKEVIKVLPPHTKVMVDANQGWTLDEAMEFIEGIGDLPLVLIEQPVQASDLGGLNRLLKASPVPISVDESLQTVDDARIVANEKAASVFSIKVSKNGGLRAGLEIGRIAEKHGIAVLMNSMLELGITQCASLHLGCVLGCLLDCGHAYMSTLRMSDDITDFSNLVEEGTARLPSGPGLGVKVDESKIRQYLVDEYHVSR